MIIVRHSQSMCSVVHTRLIIQFQIHYNFLHIRYTYYDLLCMQDTNSQRGIKKSSEIIYLLIITVIHIKFYSRMSALYVHYAPQYKQKSIICGPKNVRIMIFIKWHIISSFLNISYELVLNILVISNYLVNRMTLKITDLIGQYQIYIIVY